MRTFLALLLFLACCASWAQQPTTSSPCACTPELIMNTEHTDVHDRNFTETADTAMTYVNGIMGITGMAEREQKNVFKRLGIYPLQQRAQFKCDKAFIAAACNAGGRKFCLVSIRLSPAGTDQFVAEGNVFVRLTYRRL